MWKPDDKVELTLAVSYIFRTRQFLLFPFFPEYLVCLPLGEKLFDKYRYTIYIKHIPMVKLFDKYRYTSYLKRIVPFTTNSTGSKILTP